VDTDPYMNMPYVEHALLLPLEHTRPKKSKNSVPEPYTWKTIHTLLSELSSGTASLPIRIVGYSLFIKLVSCRSDPIKSRSIE
jgi:hypothetical protein